ncbi:hypothetical protein KB206_01550 [Microvirga sp. STS02]|uniref:hypothetical protein n=1 Tax=Hymenobacter negativus TaxID=2795026 RepID=UPI0018DD889D|nr:MULTISPECIES: hypothetical protein [Bacteria]MBH8567551.1 hypothetical protein [Hymenobacter negativus]MBR7207283.1 hypothetical protein [Microvirga sp. STS02]
MEPKNRLQEIFAEMGLALVRPTDAQLAAWDMSPTRFNQLLANKGRMPITLLEAKQLTAWLKAHFTGRHQYLFLEDMPPHERVTGKQQVLALS